MVQIMLSKNSTNDTRQPSEESSYKLERTREYLEATNPGVVDCSPELISQNEETGKEFDLNFVQNKLPLLPSFVDSTDTPELSEIPFKAIVFPKNKESCYIDNFEEVCQFCPKLLENLHRQIKINAKREVTVFKPTPIQRYLIPLLNRKEHVMANAPTGSGKTLAFALPAVIQAILKKKCNIGFRPKGPDTLILCGTRNLNQQSGECAKLLTKDTDASAAWVCGGIPYSVADLKKDILSISPGRMKEVLEKEDKNGDPLLNLSELRMIIVDEADEFFIPGKFHGERKALTEALAKVRTKHQLLGDPYDPPTIALISATLEMDDRRMTDAKNDLLGEEEAEESEFTFVMVQSEVRVEQRVIPVTSVPQKLLILTQLLDRELSAQGLTKDSRPDKYNSTCLIFVSQINSAFFLTAYLISKGYNVRPQAGPMKEKDSREVIEQFRKREIPFVVSTNKLARGIDISSIGHVINYELPNLDFESYKHRVGRTGRAGEVGVSTVLFDMHREEDRRHGESLLNCLIEAKQIVPKFLWKMFGQRFREHGYQVAGTNPDPQRMPIKFMEEPPLAMQRFDSPDGPESSASEWSRESPDMQRDTQQGTSNLTVPINYTSADETTFEDEYNPSCGTDIEEVHRQMANGRILGYDETESEFE